MIASMAKSTGALNRSILQTRLKLFMLFVRTGWSRQTGSVVQQQAFKSQSQDGYQFRKVSYCMKRVRRTDSLVAGSYLLDKVCPTVQTADYWRTATFPATDWTFQSLIGLEESVSQSVVVVFVYSASIAEVCRSSVDIVRPSIQLGLRTRGLGNILSKY
jgi:hypothetical protein